MKRTSRDWASIVTLTALLGGCVISVDGDDDTASDATANATSAAAGTSTGSGATEDTSDNGSTSAASDGTDTEIADDTTSGDAPVLPDYAGEGTLRLLADGTDLAGHDSVAASLDAVDSRLETAELWAYAYFADSGNRVIVRVPQDVPGDYEITDVDSAGAVVDVLLNTDATGLDQRIEGVLAGGTLRIDELDVATGRVRVRWVGTMTQDTASGLSDELPTSGALDVELSVVP